MKSWLYPGAKVVCKRRVWSEMDPCEIGPAYNQIVTIRHILADVSGVYIRFEEITNPPLLNEIDEPEECSFSARWFRPLTKRSTDAEVSKLKRLLNTTPADLEKVDG